MHLVLRCLPETSRRASVEPTDEDKEWFPELAGSDWLVRSRALCNATSKMKASSSQYLSQRSFVTLKLFSVLDDDRKNTIEVSAIHDDPGYRPD